MTLFDRVVALLRKNGIAHALIGAAALAARGIARSTFDIDVLTVDRRVLEAALWDDLRARPITIEIRSGDADDPLGGVVRIDAEGERPVDIVLGKHAWHARAIERADQLPDGPPIVAARDLVLLKLYAGGTQDLWDVRELLQLPGTEQLVSDVSEDLEQLPVTMRERWSDARRQDGQKTQRQ
jgi:hypothetical protein